MPRRYYRSRTRVIRPKKKWASNMVFRTFVIDSTTPIPVTNLVINSAQGNTPTPTIVKAGNFKVNADVSYAGTASTLTHLVAVVAFLPEGLDPLTNAALGAALTAHPEYIMAWRQLDSLYNAQTNVNTNINTVTFSSRLKRNLNSGDRIVFGILDQTSTATPVIRVSLTVQYWTCAN